jgi:hypothetical protein
MKILRISMERMFSKVRKMKKVYGRKTHRIAVEYQPPFLNI